MLLSRSWGRPMCRRRNSRCRRRWATLAHSKRAGCQHPVLWIQMLSMKLMALLVSSNHNHKLIWRQPAQIEWWLTDNIITKVWRWGRRASHQQGVKHNHTRQIDLRGEQVQIRNWKVKPRRRSWISWIWQMLTPITFKARRVLQRIKAFRKIKEAATRC